MAAHRGKFISYLRVSTHQQGRSGLGLEAQRTAVTTFLNGGRWDLVEEFVEVESGKSDLNRPALNKALDACLVYGATLVIAKLDRLSRDAHFLLGLQKSGVKFIAADMPEANEMVVGMMAVIAQAERKMISARTKAALAEAKLKIAVTGQKKRPDVKRLGSPLGLPPKVTQEQRLKGAMVSATMAHEFAERLRPTFAVLSGLSANAAAHELTRRGVATAHGGVWSAGKVIAIRRRLMSAAVT